jgi:hypothetical protein
MLKKEEDQNFRQIWVSHDTYRKLLKVKYALYKKDHKPRNPNEVVDKLIEFWKKNQS